MTVLHLKGNHAMLRRLKCINCILFGLVSLWFIAACDADSPNMQSVSTLKEVSHEQIDMCTGQNDGQPHREVPRIELMKRDGQIYAIYIQWQPEPDGDMQPGPCCSDESFGIQDKKEYFEFVTLRFITEDGQELYYQRFRSGGTVQTISQTISFKPIVDASVLDIEATAAVYIIDFDGGSRHHRQWYRHTWSRFTTAFYSDRFTFEAWSRPIDTDIEGWIKKSGLEFERLCRFEEHLRSHD